MAYGSYTYANPAIAAQQARDPRLAYAQGLMQQGASTAPVQSWGEGLARALQGGLGGFQAGQVNKGYQAQDEGYRTALATALKSPDPIAALKESADPTLQNLGMQYGIQLAQTNAEAKVKRINDLAAKGLQENPDGSITPITGFGTASGQIANDTNVAQIPGKVAEATALIAPEINKQTQLNPVMANRAGGEAAATLPYQQRLAAYNTGLDIASAGPKAAAAAAATEPYKDPNLVTLISPDGVSSTYNKKDPQVAALIKQGYTERSGADPNSGKYSEDQRKAAQQYLVATRELPILTQNFNALKNTMAQVANMGPEAVKNWLSSPEYQRALNSLTAINMATLRTESGATITREEAEQKARLTMPQIGESDAAIADNLARIQNQIDGIKLRAGGLADDVDKANVQRLKDLNAKYGAP